MTLDSDPPSPQECPLEQVARPGVMISNAWPQSRRTNGATLRAIEEVLEKFPFFEAYQTVDVPFANERRAIRRLLADQGHPHTYTLTRIFAKHQACLSSLDPDNRRRAIAAVMPQLDDAVEIGAGNVFVVSGARPVEPHRRAEALVVLADSLGQLADAAADRDLKLLIEPLDCEVHKRYTLGTAVEAAALCRQLASRQQSLRLCLDTSHLILNGEEPVAAVESARDYVDEFHFCNPVLDRANPLYGDQHPLFGPPGVLGPEEIATILAALFKNRFLNPNKRPGVFCEVMTVPPLAPLTVVRHCHDTLREAWHRARPLLAPSS